MFMFLDQVTIDVKAGKGRDGMIAFRREKYVPDGGPAGGDGGRGGDVILVVGEGSRTLMDFCFDRHFKAQSGENGMSKGTYDRGSEDTYVRVPQGTTVRDAETGALLGDLTENGQTLAAAKGGRDGQGNIRSASSRDPVPEIAENRESGQERKIGLKLKALTDVGLVGFPSVGEQTLLSVTLSARPKIGAYYLTALVPNLGMVTTSDDRNFAAADLPGLIKGVPQGIGLGTQFLRHIERTRITLYVIDMSGTEGRDPYEDYLVINKELSTYNLCLLECPQIVAANKMDMPDAQENLVKFKEQLNKEKENEFADDIPVLPISGVTRQGLDVLLNTTAGLLEVTPEFPLYEEELEKKTVHYGLNPEGPESQINRDSDATWILPGEKIEKLSQMTNFDHGETVMRFARQLRGMGVDEAPRARGAKNGDLVRTGEFEFEFVEQVSK